MTTASRPRPVADTVTLSTGKPGKSKIKIVLVRPNGHRTELTTAHPLTTEMVDDAEALIAHLTTGKRRSTP